MATRATPPRSRVTALAKGTMPLEIAVMPPMRAVTRAGSGLAPPASAVSPLARGVALFGGAVVRALGGGEQAASTLTPTL